jgi:hypothetical protein
MNAICAPGPWRTKALSVVIEWLIPDSLRLPNLADDHLRAFVQ